MVKVGCLTIFSFILFYFPNEKSYSDQLTFTKIDFLYKSY